MQVDQRCRYTETHEWARIEGEEAIVGITDYAQEELGEVVYVELPEVGSEVEAGEECGMIDSAKTTSPLINPVSGTVSRVNGELSEHPEYVNQSPYDKGWMYAVKYKDAGEFEKLMSPSEYEEYVKKEKGG